MKAAIFILFLIPFFITCKNSDTKTVAEKSSPDSIIIIKPSLSKTTENRSDTTLLHIDSVKNSGETFTAFYKTNDTLYVLNSKQDTILKAPDLHPGFEFTDFDGDGLKDMLVHYLSNTPAVQDLLLFDPEKKTFKLVDHFSDFPDPKALKGTRLYYSYHRSGCADMNWDSDLFYIKDFKATRIGNIAGYDCENRDIQNGIYIHKIKNGKEILFRQLDISTIQKYDDYKWGFISDYWKKNYRHFL